MIRLAFEESIINIENIKNIELFSVSMGWEYFGDYSQHKQRNWFLMQSRFIFQKKGNLDSN